MSASAGIVAMPGSSQMSTHLYQDDVDKLLVKNRWVLPGACGAGARRKRPSGARPGLNGG